MIKEEGQASKMIDPRGRLEPQDLLEDEDGRPN